MDLKFFVVAISIQLETGGNLAEILENSSHLIRERFKLFGRIKTLTAEGKLSAIILIAIPFFVGLAISFTNPDYINILFDDPIGRILVGTSLFMMFIGVMAMKKIISIKV
jgi:tight adherence protein B